MFKPRTGSSYCVRAALALAFGILGAAARGDDSPEPAPEPAAAATPAPSPAPPMEFRRFLWVTRWEYDRPADIERVFRQAAAAKFTDIFFQVRGEATVFFRSPYEPWAWELSGRGVSGLGADPGWDPLATAIREARRRGLRIHAYLNVLPAWAQAEAPPAKSGHVWSKHRSWFMVDANGRRMNTKGFYAFLDPGLPEVRDHLAKLFARLVADYPVDGVHLDYIRYPHEKGDLSYHERVVGDFKETYGKSPWSAPDKWNAYRRAQVTATVAEIRKALDQARPGVELSAAVMARTEVGYNKAFQDPRAWVAKGVIDAVVPMVYVQTMGEFREIVAPFRTADMLGRVWPGVRSFSENAAMTGQIEYSAERGFPAVAVFSYETAFPGTKSGRRAQELISIFNRAGVSARPAAASRPAGESEAEPKAAAAAPTPALPPPEAFLTSGASELSPVEGSALQARAKSADNAPRTNQTPAEGGAARKSRPAALKEVLAQK